MTTEEITNIFSYHPPTEEQRKIYEEINKQYLALALHLQILLPEGPGKTVALRKLSEARMQANACVALEGKF